MANPRLNVILEQLRAKERELEEELDRLLDQERQQFRYRLQLGKVVFDRGMRQLHRRQRSGLWRYLGRAPVAFVLSAPLIYGMALPLFLLDLSVTLYQHVCFRIYHIPRVRRADHIVIDRHQLGYLNLIEKLNCMYCGYSNGLLEYAREIAARTEQFWCPIKHARRSLDAHRRSRKFLDYADAERWRAGRLALRKDWEEVENPGATGSG